MPIRPTRKVKLSAGVAFILLMLGGCGSQSEPKSEPRLVRDTTRSFQLESLLDTGATLKLADNSTARAICDSVASKWKSIKTVQVTTIDTVLRVSDLGRRVLRTACGVVAFSPQGTKPQEDAKSFWKGPKAISGAFFGWAHLVNLDLEEPTKIGRVYQRELNRCVVTMESGPEGEPYTRETTTCWEHEHKVRGVDTVLVTPP